MKTYYPGIRGMLLSAVLFAIVGGDVWSQVPRSSQGPKTRPQSSPAARSNALYQTLQSLNRSSLPFRRTPSSAQPASYNEYSDQQKDEFDNLYRSCVRASNALALAEQKVKAETAALIERKKIVPLHPWRKIKDKTVYVNSVNSGFRGCYGKVIQSVGDGVLVDGLAGAYLGTYFIENFPYEVPDGYELDSSKFVAASSGFQSYDTVLGVEKKVPKLDYGVPCERPEGADKIEAAAQNLTSNQENQIKELASWLTGKRAEAKIASDNLQQFVQNFEDSKKRVIEEARLKKEAAKNASAAKVLKWNQEQADRGDSYGLLRMGERYRDGDGVLKDLAKAREYLAKAAAAGSPAATMALTELNRISTNSPVSK